MKFMKKNKKGFTLVELMIVVVIMAILVAVAVPIYNVVTDKARTKTCIANQRQIVSQLNTYAMNTGLSGDLPITTFTITTDDNGDAGTIALVSGTILDLDDFKLMFETVPFCPTDNGKITASIQVVSGIAKMSISCTNSGEGHVLSQDAAA